MGNQVKRVVVTGASSGIGAATVRRFSERGWQTVAVARRADRLADLAAETGAHVIVCDVTDEAQVDRMAAEVAATGGADALVNNAGGALGVDSVEYSSNADWRQMFEVNVIGLRTVTAALLPVLRDAARSHGWASILNVTSTAGHDAYPGGGGYNAAKFAAHAVTDVLRLELRRRAHSCHGTCPRPRAHGGIHPEPGARGRRSRGPNLRRRDPALG